MNESYVIKMTPITVCNLESRKNLLVNGKKIHTAIDAMGTKYYNLEDLVKCLGMADEVNVPSQTLDEKERYVFSVVNYPAELKQDGKFIAIFGTLLEVTRILIKAAKDTDSPDDSIIFPIVDAIYSNK